MPDPTPGTSPDVLAAYERLGAANELLAQFCDPASALNLSERLTPGYIVTRFRAHLDREAACQIAEGWPTPAVYGGTAPVLAQALASSIPWPELATHGLMPGDPVTHDVYGAGVLVGFDNTQWAAVLHIVAGGHVLVRFTGGEHWLASATLARAAQPAPCDGRSPF